MWKPIEGGTCEVIQGLECWIPPQPPDHEIDGFLLPKEKQRWQRPQLPDFDLSEVDVVSGTEYPEGYRLSWDEAKREEVIKQTGYDPWDTNTKAKRIYEDFEEFYVNEKMEAFRQREFDRIDNGYWFMNNGRAVYLTPFHYFYLAWWKLNTGYPDFRDTDRQLFYFWQYCWEDKRCYGILEITKRGQGKSYRMGAVAYLICVSFRSAHVGIQSKDDDEAEKFFKTKIVEPYKEIPEFFNPINNHGTEPQSFLSFFPPARRSHASRFIKRMDAIRSFMDFRSSKESAYDGSTCKFLVQDEFAKLEPPRNAQKRLGVNKDVVYRDAKMIGKIWCSSTVEDMKKGGDIAQLVYDQSDLARRSDGGRTVSGLYPFFLSALDCTFFDEYGYPLRAKAKIHHDGERKNKENDPIEWVGYVQRNPYTIEEAFRISDTDCLFNARILTDAELLCKEWQYTTRGDFEWENGVPFSRVVFIPNDVNGRWEVSYLFSNDKDSNQWDVVQTPAGKAYVPRNNHKFAQAYDPFSHSKTVFAKRRSKAGGAVFRKFDFWDEGNSDTWVADYVHRTPNPNEAHMDMLKAAFYYGCAILTESTKNQFFDFCDRNGCSEFTMMRPPATMPRGGHAQVTEGIPGSDLVIDFYISAGQVHVTHNGLKCRHLRIIENLKKFKSENRSQLDLGVAALLALVAAQRPVEYVQDGEEQAMDMSVII